MKWIWGKGWVLQNEVGAEGTDGGGDAAPPADMAKWLDEAFNAGLEDDDLSDLPPPPEAEASAEAEEGDGGEAEDEADPLEGQESEDGDEAEDEATDAEEGGEAAEPEGDDGSEDVGSGEAAAEDTPQGGAEGDRDPEFLEGMTKAEVAAKLRRAAELDAALEGIEQRLMGQLGGYDKRFEELQAGLGKQAEVNPQLDAVEKVLREYDPKLAEALVPALGEALRGSVKFSPMDEAAINPRLEKMQAEMREEIDRQTARNMAQVMDLDLAGIISPIAEDGKTWAPKTDKHRAFVDWWRVQPMDVRADLEQGGTAAIAHLAQFDRAFQAKQQRAVETTKAKVSKAKKVATTPRNRPKKKAPAAKVPKTLDDWFNEGLEAGD